MDFSWINGFSSELLRGLGITLKLLLLSGICGFALAVVVGLGRVSRNPLIRAPMQFYISVFRGTPLLVQIYILYYGVGSLFAAYPPIRGSFLWPYLREGFWYVALALTLSVGAYVGEVLRGGLRAVPRGELEAARAYGMGHWLTLRRVWLPGPWNWCARPWWGNACCCSRPLHWRPPWRSPTCWARPTWYGHRP
ncbi:hypothetical protein PBOI14_63670 [Pseudomonas sp. Boi14]|nr:hypothetical protein PBOI14_63670 [Pseudomonas sp. Boi14]